MATAAAAHYGRDCEGIVIQPADPAGSPTAIPGFRHYRAPHPIPDERSVDAGCAALDLASALAADDLLLVLLSGGGSALIATHNLELAARMDRQIRLDAGKMTTA